MNLPDRNEGGVNFNLGIIQDLLIRNALEELMNDKEFLILFGNLTKRIDKVIEQGFFGKLNEEESFISRVEAVSMEFMRDYLVHDSALPYYEVVPFPDETKINTVIMEYAHKITIGEYYYLLTVFKEMTGYIPVPSRMKLDRDLAQFNILDSIIFLLSEMEDYIYHNKIELMRINKEININFLN